MRKRYSHALIMNKEILRLAIPNILSNISVPLLSTVDTALMGRLSETHIGAVGVGAMIFNFIYWNFGFLRMGTTGMTAQAYGKGSDGPMADVFGRAIFVAAIIAALILALQVPIGDLSFGLMNMTGEQRELVSTYFYIRVWAAPASLALYALFGWFFGMQNAIFPLIITIAINIVNIFLSYWLVYQWNWGVEGVAWGTLIAQYFGLLMAIGLFFWKYGHLARRLRLKAILAWAELKPFLVINRDIFIRTLALTFVFAYFYSQSAVSGELVLAANTILMQFVNWMSYGIDGFAFAAESLVGKYKGANNEEETKRAVNYSLIWGMATAAVFSLVYWLGGPFLLEVFTDQPNVIAFTLPLLFWVILLPIIGAPCYIWDGIYIGLTASKSMRNIMVIALIFFLILYLGFMQPYGNFGLWLSLLLFLMVRGAVQHYWYWRKGLDMQ